MKGEESKAVLVSYGSQLLRNLSFFRLKVKIFGLNCCCIDFFSVTLKSEKKSVTADNRVKQETIMAIAIKTIPVLTGEAAERFVMEAEENAKRPTPKLSPERKSRLEMVLNQMRDFQFQ